MIVVYIFLMFVNRYEVLSQKDVLTIDCEHIYNSPAIFPASALSSRFTFPHSYNASVLIKSSCCGDFHPNNSDCGSCSASGEMTCFVQQDSVIDLHTGLNSSCLNETVYYFICHELLCNGSFAPSYATACDNETNTRQICLSNGSWKSQSCLETTTFIHQSITTKSSHHTETEVLSTEVPTNLTDTSHGVAVQLTTSQDGRDETTSLGSILPTDTDTSTVPSSFETEEIRHDWVNFLIALGVTLVVVVIIVCGFFIRKRNKAKEKDDYSLEYWHETEYIDSICGKASCSINQTPKEIGQVQPSQRYIRKDDFCNTSPLANQSLEKGLSDIPRKMKNDYTDKYVTTAAGSNFYSYSTSPDVDLAVTGSNLSPPRIPRVKLDVDVDKTSSFKPKYKKQQKGRKRQLEEKPSNSVVDDDEIYAVSYKNKLKRELNDWSAEESDV